MLKAAFWIGVIVIALPFVSGDGDGLPSDYEPQPVQLGEVTAMVRTTASDFMRLCERQPDACDTGQRIMWNTRVAASDLAGKAQDWLRRGSDPDTLAEQDR